MKRCPKCYREYKDDTLRFCLEDGTSLSSITREAPATELLPRVTPTQKSSTPTIPSYRGNESAPVLPTETPRSNPILTAGVIAIALLLLTLVGMVGLFVIRQSNAGDSASSNQAASPTPGASPINSNGRSAATPEDLSSSNQQDTRPLRITASASSIRLAVQANTYYASNAIDGKRGTAWIEGVDGPGIGEWIRFDFDREINLHRILFQPGYFKSPSVWAQNNRLASVTAQFSDGSSRQLNFSDRMESQKIDIPSVKTRWVRLVIESVYYGSDPDTALSEVAFEWEP